MVLIFVIEFILAVVLGLCLVLHEVLHAPLWLVVSGMGVSSTFNICLLALVRLIIILVGLSCICYKLVGGGMGEVIESKGNQLLAGDSEAGWKKGVHAPTRNLLVLNGSSTARKVQSVCRKLPRLGNPILTPCVVRSLRCHLLLSVILILKELVEVTLDFIPLDLGVSASSRRRVEMSMHKLDNLILLRDCPRGSRFSLLAYGALE